MVDRAKLSIYIFSRKGYGEKKYQLSKKFQDILKILSLQKSLVSR